MEIPVRFDHAHDLIRAKVQNLSSAAINVTLIDVRFMVFDDPPHQEVRSHHIVSLKRGAGRDSNCLMPAPLVLSPGERHEFRCLSESGWHASVTLTTAIQALTDAQLRIGLRGRLRGEATQLLHLEAHKTARADLSLDGMLGGVFFLENASTHPTTIRVLPTTVCTHERDEPSRIETPLRISEGRS